MKRLIVAVVVFMFSVVVAGSSVAWKKNILLKTEENFASCIVDDAVIYQKTEQAINEWNRSKEILFLFAEQEDFSEVENKLITLKSIPESETSVVICKEIIMMFKELRKNSDISLEKLL